MMYVCMYVCMGHHTAVKIIFVPESAKYFSILLLEIPELCRGIHHANRCQLRCSLGVRQWLEDTGVHKARWRYLDFYKVVRAGNHLHNSARYDLSKDSNIISQHTHTHNKSEK